MIDYSFIVNIEDDEDFILDLGNINIADLYLHVADIIDESSFDTVICTNITEDHRSLFINDLLYSNRKVISFEDLPQYLKNEVSSSLLDRNGKLKLPYLESVGNYAVELARMDAKSSLDFFKSSDNTFKKYYKYPSYEKELHELEELVRNPEKLIKWR